jgi:hypothetical protein
MRSFIQRRSGGSEYTAGVHGTSRSELRGVYAVQPGPRSYGLIDNASRLVLTDRQLDEKRVVRKLALT